MGNDVALVTHFQQTSDGLATLLAIVQRALVHIHADEAAGELTVKITGKLHGVFEGFVAMIERVLNAFLESHRDFMHQLRTQFPLDGIST